MYLFEKFSISLLLVSGATYCSSESSDKNEKMDHQAKRANALFQKVIDKYRFDPFYKNESVTHLPTSDIKLSDIYVEGLKKCIAKDTVDREDETYKQELDCPNMTMKFNYEVNGTYVDVELNNQKGVIEVSLGKMETTVTGDYTEYMKNKTTHFDIGNFTIEATPKGNVTILRNTVSEGDQAKADEVTTNFNVKYQDAAKQFAQNTMKEVLLNYYNAYRDNLHKHSMEEIVDD